MTTHLDPAHPLLEAALAIRGALKDVADVSPVFMPISEKRTALLELSAAIGQVEELRMRVLATADDVADADGARNPASSLAHHAHLDRGQAAHRLHLARSLDTEHPAAALALRQGVAHLAQVDVVIRALDALPDTVEADVRTRAEEHLVSECDQFAPARLRTLGRRVLDVVAPEVGEHEEARLLDREEAHAEAVTSLHTRVNGDGTTDIRLRVADAVAHRLLTYLHAYTSPRNPDNQQPGDRQASGPSRQPRPERRPYDQRLGQAFGAFLEQVDPTRMPVHGGDATTVIITIDLAILRGQLQGIGLVGDQPITAGDVRRLTCTVGLTPAVLGGDSEILDLGRTHRLFTRHQRKAMALRDGTCRAEGCDIPAPWCEAHHRANPWSQGGRTDLADGVLLCSHHHHRAHDHHYASTALLDGRIRFRREP